MLTDRELDQLIDAALSSYSAKAARPGLEQRILRRALADQPRKRWFTWAWAFLVTAAACAIMVVFFAGEHNSHRSALEATAAPAPAVKVGNPHETAPTNALPSPRKRPISPKASTRPPAAPEALPKEEVFPSPSPLTAEEQAAIALTRARMPPQSDPAEIEIKPIHIAELQIKPLTPPEGDLLGSLVTENPQKPNNP